MNITQIAIYFADQYSRKQALTASESDMLIQLITEQRKHEPRPGKVFWTAKDDRTLRRLRGTHRASEIADKMGRTTRAVETRLLRLKQRNQVELSR
jgi:hypothetical protein